jgi:hypothetical protein
MILCEVFKPKSVQCNSRMHVMLLHVALERKSVRRTIRPGMLSTGRCSSVKKGTIPDLRAHRRSSTLPGFQVVDASMRPPLLICHLDTSFLNWHTRSPAGLVPASGQTFPSYLPVPFRLFVTVLEFILAPSLAGLPIYTLSMHPGRAVIRLPLISTLAVRIPSSPYLLPRKCLITVRSLPPSKHD